MSAARDRVEPVRLLRIAEAAEFLRSCENHVYKLISTGVLRAVDIAPPGSRRSKTRVRSDDLADYIERQTRQVPRSASGHVRRVA